MASGICLDCGDCFWPFLPYMSIDTKNEDNHHIVIIAKGNIIDGIEARY